MSQECLMKQFQVGLLILALAFPIPARAADGGAPGSYTGSVVDD